MKFLALILTTLPLLAADLPTPVVTQLDGNQPPGIRVTWEYPLAEVTHVEAWTITRWFKSDHGAGATNWLDHDYTLGRWSWPLERHVAGSASVMLCWTDTNATPGQLYSYSVQALGAASDSKDSALADGYIVNRQPTKPVRKAAWKPSPQAIPLELSPFAVSPPLERQWQTNVFAIPK